jgi:hypothetical protein
MQQQFMKQALAQTTVSQWVVRVPTVVRGRFQRGTLRDIKIRLRFAIV